MHDDARSGQAARVVFDAVLNFILSLVQPHFRGMLG